MSGILIPCPKCGSGLKLKDRTNLGKTGRCPKCSHRFILAEPDEVELELADASVPSTGTAAKWVPDSAASVGSSAMGSQTAVAEAADSLGLDFSLDLESTPSAGMPVATVPTIALGMSLAEVTALLGKPAKRKRMADLAVAARKQGKVLDLPPDAEGMEYIVFEHRAGAYKLVFRDDKVAEIQSQPDPQSAAKIAPPPVKKSRRGRKNKWAGIGVGGVLGAVLVGVMVYVNQNDPPAKAEPKPKKEPPKLSQGVVADKKEMADNVAFAKAFTQEHFATQGELITFERIPAGANIIIHLRPAELWSDEHKFAEFRAALTSEFITEWLEPAIKQHCLFEPQEIEEALICILLGGRGEMPQVAARVKLMAPKKRSDFPTLFGGVSNNDFGIPVYEDGERAILVEADNQTFAVAPKELAEEMARSRQSKVVSKPGIESVAMQTDKQRHVTVIFQPFDVLVHKEALVAENVRPALNKFLDWLNVEDVDTVLWSMHLGDQKFYSQLVLRPASQAENQWTPSDLEKSVEKKLSALPKDLYAAVQMMAPQQLGFRKIIGRFPAMMQVVSLSTLGGVDNGAAQFTTILPAKAAPNLALGTLLAWDESTRTDFTKGAPPTQSEDPKLPDLIVDRLKLPMDVDFRRRPLQDAFKDIGEATYVKIEIDGDALKFAGYTQNMPQTFTLGEVPATEAIAKILSQYDKMCVCITDEDKNIVTVMTLDVAKEKKLTPLKF